MFVVADVQSITRIGRTSTPPNLAGTSWRCEGGVEVVGLDDVVPANRFLRFREGPVGRDGSPEAFFRIDVAVIDGSSALPRAATRLLFPKSLCSAWIRP